jgi:hypothetical protein
MPAPGGRLSRRACLELGRPELFIISACRVMRGVAGYLQQCATCRWKVCVSLAHNPHWQRLIALHETRIDARGLAYHLDVLEAFQNLLPDDLQLQFGQAQP